MCHIGPKSFARPAVLHASHRRSVPTPPAGRQWGVRTVPVPNSSGRCERLAFRRRPRKKVPSARSGVDGSVTFATQFRSFGVVFGPPDRGIVCGRSDCFCPESGAFNHKPRRFADKRGVFADRLTFRSFSDTSVSTSSCPAFSGFARRCVIYDTFILLFCGEFCRINCPDRRFRYCFRSPPDTLCKRS